MMNNHFHMQHEHTPQNVAQPYLQQQQQPPLSGPAPVPTPAPTYSYLPQQQNVQEPQWMTYQIMPPTQGIATGGDHANGPKRYYATTAQPAHPRTIQINNSYGQQNPSTKQQAASSSTSASNPFKTNNIRIISTAPSVYSLNKSSSEQRQLYAPVQSYYMPQRQAGALPPRQLSQVVAGKQHTLPPREPGTLPASHNQPPTVVLDRINICINNLYSDAASTNLTTSLGTAQQPSPIIPAIQHKAQAILPLIDSSTADSSSSSSSSVSSSSYGGGTTTSAAVIVIDEPDSTTTTPQTPPTTPETMSSPGKSSPSPPPPPTPTPPPPPPSQPTLIKVSSQKKPSFKSIDSAPPTPPTPPPPAISFALQEDVFVKCDDGRLYLGTIVGESPDQFLIRFDDQSEQWHESDKLRKLGGGGTAGGSGKTGNSSDSSNAAVSGPMCVACKRLNLQDIVEICERCGRGYHRGCTTEIAHGSGIWSCKRCVKPMKMQQPLNYETTKKPPGICRQLPYHADKLSWDEKHRVNEEQIYCYCGKPGKFDHNMLQCCKCQNWFHTQCMQNFKEKLLRGDTFFVFCCTVCNDGVEYVRRLQIDWVDILHIALYNLRKHQHQKYHHLLKDIWPFVLEQRHKLPISEQWKTLPETALMERIKQTLKDRTERFVCGREFKRAPNFFALRHSGPPVTPKVWLQPHEEVCDEVLVNKFNILLMTREESGSKDVYEFRTDEDEEGTNTSEDEIPIKQIIEKAKKKANKMPAVPELQQDHRVTVDTIDLADDNANDGDHGKLPAPIPPQPNAKSSRKRKAFHLSRRYDNSRNHCDLSSDENSSSSRGTSSLDLIIPPPVNFLGRNNPFLMATPKKSTQVKKGLSFGLGTGVGVAGVINSIFKLKGGGMDQPRVVRTIKRRLSAKDITIGPNQEVRKRRNRRMTTAVEIINTTTINPLSSPYFPLYAKDLLPPAPPPDKPTHGRLLRQRPQKSARSSPNQSRRNSISSTATSGSSSAGNGHSILDLKQSVNKYFGGAMNRIDAGESFAIRAKRRMGNGQVQYLVEWGGDAATTTNGI
uniref:PCL n=2 Tax=Drosophila subobscura TaxID=7241 RepID=A0A224L185_DROSU|nr:PCL [Drosophila subobscura]